MAAKFEHSFRASPARPDGRVCCPSCATDQEAPANGAGECLLCGASLAIASKPGATTAAAAPLVELLAEPVSSRKARPRASIPPVEVGTEPPRGFWRAAPVGLIGAGAALCALVFQAPSPAALREQRIAADAYALAGKVREYRARLGYDLDEATWSGWVSARSEPRLFDPWGNPYAFRRDSKTFTIICHGADGAPGGEGAAKDVEFAFRTGSGMPASANNIP